MRQAPRLSLAATSLMLWSSALTAETRTCDNDLVAVHNATVEVAEQVCDAADRAFELFGTCGLSLSGPVTITLAEAIEPACFGMFHCGEARIDLLTPEAMAAAREPTSAFVHVPTERFFDSVVVHELAHALYDVAECPVGNCMATAEYLAYYYQIASLSDVDRAPFEAELSDGERVARDEINALMVMMAPDQFASAAWRHMKQRDNQCDWIAGVLSGAILFDHELP